MESFEISSAAKRRLMPAEGVKVKDKRNAEGEVGPRRPEKGETTMKTDDLWMQLKRQTVDTENHIRRLASCDRQDGVTAEEPSFDKKEPNESVKKAAIESGAEREIIPSPADGSHAFESEGVLNEEAMPTEEKAKEAPVAMPAGEGSFLLVAGQKVPQFRRYKLAKQSGVPNIGWSTNAFAWHVCFPKADPKGKFISRTSRRFPVKKFMVQGRSEAEADAAALEAAKAFHAELVEKGILKLKDPEFTSEVLGVFWAKRERKWVARVTLNKRKIYDGCFAEKAAAEAKALELREKHGLQLQVKPVATLANLPVFQPKVPYPGVKWYVREQQWRAQYRVGGANRDFRVKPKDHSEAELERSFKVAVEWKKKQEKRKKGKAAKPKVKPPKE